MPGRLGKPAIGSIAYRTRAIATRNDKTARYFLAGIASLSQSLSRAEADESTS